MADETAVPTRGTGDADGPPPPAGVRPARVAGIGSSAGGLEALAEMLRSLPLDLSISYVVAQHLSPAHDSPLAEILGRETPLPVRVATDGAALEAGVILVAAPNTDVSISDGIVSVSTPGLDPGPKPSIDVLLRSLARSWGEHAVGVVLSGTGHDGTDGLRAVHIAGGLTIAQDPHSARFDAMPSSARSTGEVDLVLTPAEIGPALARTATPPPVGATSGEGGQDLVEAILLTLRATTGIDFTDYKRSTVVRQIARRMSLRDIDDIAQYRQSLAEDAEEARALSRLMLVTVTSFFRDPAVWDALAAQLGDLIDRLAPDQQLRVWVPGCATGEEAYTVAMLCADALGAPADLPHRLKIFATDLNDDSLNVARAARYPDDAVQSIPVGLRERWLRRVGDSWEVAPALRDATVFARHNVALDPPFPRIDLISMRNVLIYFQSPMQDRVLRLCHFGLTPGGILLLGESERIPVADPLFTAVDATGKIYRRRSIPTPHPLPAPRRTTYTASDAGPGAGTPSRDRGDWTGLREALVRRFAPPSLITDDRDEVIEVIGDVSRWCWVAEGRHSSNVEALLRDELKPVVRSLLLQLRHSTVDSAGRDITTAHGPVHVEVRLLGSDAAGPAVVSFTEPTSEDGTPHPGGSSDGTAAPAGDAELMQRELDATRDALQSTIEELAASNEELQVMNEELQASAEELQVSGEEVQASNEELEATNEELRTLNQELQVRASELSVANADLQNIEDSLTSGLVLLDRNLRVTRFTPLAVRLFALIDQDVGRPLTAIPTTVPLPTLERDLRATVAGETVALQEVSDDSGDFLLQLQPYRGPDDEIRGAVLVVTDIAELASARREVAHRLREHVVVTETVREMVWRRDATGRLQFVNSRVEELFGLSRDRVLADPELLTAAIHPDDRDRVQLVTAAAQGEWNVEYPIIRPDGAVRWIKESATLVPAAGDELPYTVGSASDVTQEHELATAAAARAALLRAVMDNGAFGVAFLDDQERIARTNDLFARIVGAPADVLIGMTLDAAMPLGDPAPVDDVPPIHEPEVERRQLPSPDGTERTVTIRRQTIPSVADAPEAQMVIVQDVTRRESTSRQLIDQARFDQQTGLAGRAYFSEHADTALRRAARSGGHVAILWIDLDGFKAVNDHYGHQTGDTALNEIAARLQETARAGDLVGRLGGDEFAVLLADATARDAVEALTERVLTAMREPIAVAGATIHLSGSVGIAVSPDDGEDAASLLRNADTAMYEAKELGRDRRTYFRAEMNEAAEQRAQRRHQLAASIRDRDFAVHYQPIVASTTGEVRMAEALIRWRHGDDLVLAEEFIELAEQTGQLRPIGRIMLEQLDQDLQRLDREYHSQLPIAVNISPTQLEDRDTADWLLAWNPPGGLQRIVIEVTESASLTQHGRSLDMLRLLQRLGARISVDDFGTGYSNLSLLDRLRPNIIKIDRGLLRPASTDPHALEVFTAAVHIAHALAEEVVVEGIETEQEQELVRQLSVELSQGFHVAGAMPLSALATWSA